MEPLVSNNSFSSVNNSFSSDTDNSLHVAQINIHRCVAAVDEVSALFCSNRFSVIAVQECYNRDGVPYGFSRNCRVVYSGVNPSVCFVIDLNLSFTLLKNFQILISLVLKWY